MTPSTTAALIKAAKEVVDSASYMQQMTESGKIYASPDMAVPIGGMEALRQALAAIEAQQQPTGGGEDAKAIVAWWDEHKRLKEIYMNHPGTHKSGGLEVQQAYKAEKEWSQCYHDNVHAMIERAVEVIRNHLSPTQPPAGCAGLEL